MSERDKNIIDLSEEIISDFEMDRIAFEKILFKCQKLARLTNDKEAEKWFAAELMGYQEQNVTDIKDDKLQAFAGWSGRYIKTKDNAGKEIYQYWTDSVPEIESEIETDQISYKDSKGNHLAARIKKNKGLLAKIRSHIYIYVVRINHKYKFGKILEDIFIKMQKDVNKKLQEISPDIIDKFIAVYDRLPSTNPEEWSQALSTCRNIIKAFANVVFPARKEKFVRNDGTEIDVTDDKYKNRIIAFIDQKAKDDKAKLLMARVSDLDSRVIFLHNILSKGTHNDLKETDINLCVIETYMILGSLVLLMDEAGEEKQ